MKKILAGVCLAAGVWIGTAVIAAEAADLKIALIYSKTGPLEAYAKQTEAGLMLGLEYLTGGTMMLDGQDRCPAQGRSRQAGRGQITAGAGLHR